MNKILLVTIPLITIMLGGCVVKPAPILRNGIKKARVIHHPNRVIIRHPIYR